VSLTAEREQKRAAWWFLAPALALIGDLRDTNGWVTSREIADRVGIAGTEAHATRSVGVRLGWMRRYGVVVKNDDNGKVRWRLTADGERVLAARLGRGAVTALTGVSEEQLLAAAHVLTNRYAGSRHTYRTLVRREWQRELRRS